MFGREDWGEIRWSDRVACKPEQGGMESVNVLTVEKDLSGDWW